MKDSLRKSFLFSSAKMGIATLMSRILGLLREQLMAYYFGAQSITDGFFVAYRIPNLLRDLLAEGAFSSAFVPEFSALKIGNKAKAWKYFRYMLLFMVLIGIGLTGLFYIGSGFFINLFAPSFDTETFHLSSSLLKIMSPYLLFVSVAALLMGVLNSHKIFFIPALSPVFFNITIITGLLACHYIASSYSISPLVVLGFFVSLGGFIQIIVQVPKIVQLIKQTSTKSSETVIPEVKKTLIKLGPGLLGMAATQINLLLVTIMASSLPHAVSWLNYAFRLFQFPVGIIGVSFGNSHTVYFSELWKQEKFEEAKNFQLKSLEYVMGIMAPIILITILFSDIISAVVFYRGAFSLRDVHIVSSILTYYAPGLLFYSMHKVLVPTYYCIDLARIPVVTSVIGIVVNLVFCFYLKDELGPLVFALGTTISMGINVGLLSIYLVTVKKWRYGLVAFKNIVKILLVSCFLLIVGIYIKRQFEINFDNFFNLILILLVGSTLLFGIMLVLLEIFGVKILRKKNGKSS